MKIKNIIINVSSVLIISTALPAIAHEEAPHSEIQGEGLAQEVFTPHTDKYSATNTHYMMHSGGDHQGHLMEGATHGEKQATEHEKQLITSSQSDAEKNKHYMMNSGEGQVSQGYLMEGRNHPEK